MSQVNFPITLPSSPHPRRANDIIDKSSPHLHCTNNIIEQKMLISSSSTSSSSCSFSTNVKYPEDTRDDYNVQLEEDRNRLFGRASSLSFSIEHYSLMVEKVFISFLRSYKRHCTMLNSRSQSIRAYMLGNRLRIFIKEVLPSHIHYHTDFKGHERLLIISSQVDEYLDNLKDDMDLDDPGQCIIGQKKNLYKDKGGSLFVPLPDSVGQRDINQRSYDDPRENESCEKEEEINFRKMDKAIDDKEESTDCGSSTSTSYSASSKVDWDDCECSETLGKNNGFILKEQDDKVPKENEKDTGGQENSDRPDTSLKQQPSDNVWINPTAFEGENQLKGNGEVDGFIFEEGSVIEGEGVFDFNTLISHWKEQEKKWIEKNEDRF